MENNCKHRNKAYSPQGITLTSYPPIHVSYGICKDCGHEGQESHQDKLNTEYDDAKRKFSATPLLRE